MSTTPVRRWALAGGAWLLTVVVATAVATGAVGSLRQGIFGASDAPYSEAEVEALLAAASPSVGGPASPSPAGPVASPGVVRALGTPGGSVVAGCEAGLATLRSWTPNPGFEADHVQRGPAAVASLRFKARGGDDVRAQVTCPGGEPTLALVGDD